MIRHILTFVILVFPTLQLAALQSAEREYLVSQSIPHGDAKVGGAAKLAMGAKGDYCIVARADRGLVSVFELQKQGWSESSRLEGDSVSSPSGIVLGRNSTSLILGLVDRNLSVYKLKDGGLEFQAKTLAGKTDVVTQHRDLVLHPSGRWFYFVADVSNQLWVGALSAKDVPSLTQCFEGGTANGTARTIDGVSVAETAGIDYPRSPVVSPDGKDLYVACFKNHSVAHFRIHQTTGVLSFVGHTKEDKAADMYAHKGLTGPYSIGISIDGKLLVVGGAGKGATVFVRDPATGEIADGTSLLSDTAIGNIAAIRMSPNGKYLAVVCGDENYIDLFVRTAVGKFTYEATLNNNTVSKPVLSGVSDACFSLSSTQILVTSDASSLATIELRSK
jgi:WD40 repeat protein